MNFVKGLILHSPPVNFTSALKHIAMGKCLSSIENLSYTTGSFCRRFRAGPNSLWRIEFDKEIAFYGDTSITLQHIKSNKFLGLYYGYRYGYYKSPITEHTEDFSDNLEV
ncbi:hypothetical protein C1645_825426 [Glomus cerebriforme]|uniref:Uncharacterized protein n=1 Tax=Glomus cerebriforme TaxID=658196 RepID=A0A397SST3_9GLOM|nr:hypothetical protein C1645_825426 [Glomus cerebriforme]